MILTFVPNWVLGVTVLAVLGFYLLKFFGGAAVSVFDSLQNASDNSAIRSEIDGVLSDFDSDFAKNIAEIYCDLEEGVLDDFVVASGKKLEQLKSALEDIVNIEVYDDSILIGKPLGTIKQLVSAQMNKYHYWSDK